MTSNKLKIILSTLFVAVSVCQANADTAAPDKVDNEQQLFETLSTDDVLEDIHSPLIISYERLRECDEKRIYVMEGDNYQVQSLRADCYVTLDSLNYWKIIYDQRYPMESAVNLLLNYVADNGHNIDIAHHQYGGKISHVVIPLQKLFNVMGRQTRIYCSVTSIDSHITKAVLVFHNSKLDFIHMLTVSLPTAGITNPDTCITADLYSFIPQASLKSILSDKLK